MDENALDEKALDENWAQYANQSCFHFCKEIIGVILFNLCLKAYKAIDRLAIIGKYILLVYLYV